MRGENIHFIGKKTGRRGTFDSVVLGTAVTLISVPLFGINVLISERGGTGGWENSLYSRYNQPQLWQRVAALYYLSK